MEYVAGASLAELAQQGPFVAHEAAEFIRQAAEAARRETQEQLNQIRRAAQEQIKKYVLANFYSTKAGTRPRVMLLVFRGEDAVQKIREVVGHILHERTSGETIRDTYGDYVTDANGTVTYFEPAVLAAIRGLLPDARGVATTVVLAARGTGKEGATEAHG